MVVESALALLTLSIDLDFPHSGTREATSVAPLIDACWSWRRGRRGGDVSSFAGRRARRFRW